MESTSLEGIAKELEGMWEENSDGFLTEDHGIEVKFLIKIYGKFKMGESSAEDLIFESEAVRNRAWEMLNVGKWSDVAEEWKQVYAIASFLQVVGLMRDNKPNALEKSLEVADLGILLGFPFRSISLTRVADILSKKLNGESEAEVVSIDPSVDHVPAGTSGSGENPSGQIEIVRRPSLESFYRNYMVRNRPVKLTGCIDHWPALSLWQDFGYLVRKAGRRTVPIELGKHYADDGYSQKLMKISDFVEEFFGENPGKMGYLAQHQLFDQVPELKRDIIEPDYCSLSLNPEGSAREPEINAWFGPKGTVSPLHFDPKNNLLCQVVGSKKIILHSQSERHLLYPHEGSLLFNTSRVDVENPDLSEYPDYEKAVREECVLRPGEILFIPPGYWHHVRSLENSFSVSFWWD